MKAAALVVLEVVFDRAENRPLLTITDSESVKVAPGSTIVKLQSEKLVFSKLLEKTEVGLGVGVGVGEGEGVGVGEGDGVELGDGVGEGLGVGDGIPLNGIN